MPTPTIDRDESPTDAVEAFIAANVSPCDTAPTLAEPTDKTTKTHEECLRLFALERRRGGVYAVDGTTPSRATSHDAGYLISPAVDDVCVGLQANEPLVRCVKPLGGTRVVATALEERGETLNERVKTFFDEWVTTHNDAVFECYTPEMRAVRKAHLLLGLPDAYGRGRLIGDYRRVALFGVDALTARKRKDKEAIAPVSEETIRHRFEVSQQIKALDRLKRMAAMYGFDVGAPAKTAKECVQWTYFGYLAAVKENDGAAISLGRVDAFFDVYIERDFESGVLTDESQAQELIDAFVLKLRLVRHLRPKSYAQLFAGDPSWITNCVGGMTLDGEKSLVTKTSWRFLQTLRNLGPAPEPNMTVLWSESLPDAFREFATEISIESSSIQFISDDSLREKFCSADVGISCCVSGMELGKTMQYFGARANVPKLLLYAINNGRDEITGAQVAPPFFDDALEGALRYDQVMERFNVYLKWLSELYVRTMNVIHYCHDRFNYEAIFFALIDTEPRRLMAFGIAGLSVVADSLSAIKHAAVKVVRDDKTGLSTAFEIEGEYPCFGNDVDSVDEIAAEVCDRFITCLRATRAHRDAEHTLSILTITSNVMYGKATGATPDGRKLGEAFAPGANPMHNRDKSGALSSLNSVAKIPYSSCLDGVSNTFSITAPSLGKTKQSQALNLAALLDGYMHRGAMHINVNCVDRSVLLDAMAHPENHPTLTIRVSGYAVNFIKLSREHQEEVIARTFHASL